MQVRTLKNQVKNLQVRNLQVRNLKKYRQYASEALHSGHRHQVLVMKETD
jgi:hypothetical protein